MKYLFGFLLVIFSTFSFGVRTMIVPPIETASGLDGFVCSSGMSHIITVRNVGNTQQTISVRTLEATIFIGADEPAILSASNWVPVLGISGKFTFTKNFSPTLDPMDPLVVQPGDTTVRHNHFGCDLQRQNVGPCYNGFNSDPDAFDATERVVQSYLISGKAFFQIEIAENDGSVIASVFSHNTSSCGGGINTTYHNILVNGGRPF